MDENEKPAPIPLNLDWESPEGIRHHEQMSALPEDDPVRIAHFANLEQQAAPAAKEPAPPAEDPTSGVS